MHDHVVEFLRNSVNMSTHPESSDRSATTSSADLANLGAQLSEALNKFNEFSMEMAVQRRMIDQLVAGSNSGVQHDSLPASQPEPQPLPLPYTHPFFAPHFVNPPEEPVTYPTHGLPHTYTSTIPINSSHTQVPQKKNCCPPVGLLITFPLEGSFNELGELFLVKIHENHSYVCPLFNYVFVNNLESSDF